MFSFVPRCHELRGAAKKTLTPDSRVNRAWSDSSLLRSQVNSPTQTLRTQSNYVFMAIYVVFKLKCLSVRSKINLLALRFKLVINATRSAFDQLQKFQADA